MALAYKDEERVAHKSGLQQVTSVQ